MKHTIPALLLLLVTCSVHAQLTGFIDSLLSNRSIKLPAYETDSISHQSIVLGMHYAGDTFTDTTGLYRLHNAQVLSVDLLFTDYPQNDNLRELNKRRLIALCWLLPFLPQQKDISWTIVRQTNGHTPATAAQLVHGFVINYRPPYLPADKQRELALIRAVTPDSMPVATTPPGKVYYWGVIHKTDAATAHKLYGRTVRTLTDSRAKLERARQSGDSLLALAVPDAQKQHILSERQTNMLRLQDSVFILLAPAPSYNLPSPPAQPARIPAPVYIPPDSTVLTLLRDNRFERMLVVADVTGSMSPYIAQLIRWASSQDSASHISYFACFNDGDNKKDEDKRIGHTGGIYLAPYRNSHQASALIQKAMQNGDGGDLQENVCEALIRAIHDASSFSHVVLIADSWAPVRDISLVTEIHQPVEIMVCGKRPGIHPDYITLALRTGGALHFMGEPPVDLSPLLDSKKICIRNRYYLYDGTKVAEAISP